MDFCLEVRQNQDSMQTLQNIAQWCHEEQTLLTKFLVTIDILDIIQFVPRFFTMTGTYYYDMNCQCTAPLMISFQHLEKNWCLSLLVLLIQSNLCTYDIHPTWMMTSRNRNNTKLRVLIWYYRTIEFLGLRHFFKWMKFPEYIKHIKMSWFILHQILFQYSISFLH